MSKVLLVTGIYPPDIGGPASHFHELVKYLDATKKLDFNIITLSNGRNTKVANYFFVNRNIKNPIRFFLVVLKITFLSYDSRIIYSGGLYLESYIASLLTGKKLVCRVVGDPVWERARNKNKTKLDIDEFQSHTTQSFLIKIEKNLFKYIFRRAKNIVTPSEYLRNIIVGWGVDKNKLMIITNATQIEPNNNILAYQKKYDLVTVCRLVSWKGVDELIEISWMLNLSLAIVGDGPERQKLETKAKNYGNKVVFFGSLDRVTTVDVLLSSKIFFLNSSYEGLPHSLLEAMSLGMPCVVTETGGSKAVLTNNLDGILVPIYDKNKKIIELSKLISNPYTQNKLSKNAIQTIKENYSLNNQMDSLMKLFLSE